MIVRVAFVLPDRISLIPGFIKQEFGYYLLQFQKMVFRNFRRKQFKQLSLFGAQVYLHSFKPALVAGFLDLA